MTQETASRMQPGLPVPIVTLWVAGSLSPIENLCLTSFVRNGHKVTLYTYEGVDNAPAGVELRDGREVLPFETVRENRYANGSYALASNLFRYELMRLGMGMWVDTDVVSLRPVLADGEVIAGWETPDYINGAVLYLAGHLPIIADAIATFHSGGVPPWINWRQGLVPRIKHALGTRLRAPDLPHGSFGPKGVTALLRKYGMDRLARAPDVFYPLAPRDARKAFDGTLHLDEIVTENSLTLHLWNEKIGDLKQQAWRQDAMISEIARRYS